MTGSKQSYEPRAEEDNPDGVEPRSDCRWRRSFMSPALPLGNDTNTISGLHITARLKALGVRFLNVERNQRIGDNWLNRYEYLFLHLPHWPDHFPYFPFPEHWPTYTPVAKMGDWLKWYASALELTAWTDSNVAAASKNPQGRWEIAVQRTR